LQRRAGHAPSFTTSINLSTTESTSMPYSLAFRLGAAYVEARHFDLVNAGDYAQYVRNIKGNRVANEVLLDAIGLTLRPELDNDYYREALEYHLGLLYAHLGQPERAAERRRSASTSW